ncbi:Hypothetical protein chromosome condensation [Nesidiocoris tenuis]|uniref:Uncharacterized protein n=1 Tax=Nesidiocoris tenuis TaxID=355587 RepID=A0ABN7BAM2_9HEMI|nr:Hypothetical protein chromosome condensation [Nesidiocoris tenuis]
MHVGRVRELHRRFPFEFPENGELWGCGWNKYGQLALEGIEYVSTMTKLPVPPDKKILKVECGYWHTAIFVEDNAV